MFLRNSVGLLMLVGAVLFIGLVVRDAFAVWPGERLRILPFVNAGLVRFTFALVVGLVLTVGTVIVAFGAAGVFVEGAQKPWGTWFVWTSIVIAGFLVNAALTAGWQLWMQKFGATGDAALAFPITGQSFLNAGCAAFTFVWWWIATAFRLLRPSLPSLG